MVRRWGQRDPGSGAQDAQGPLPPLPPSSFPSPGGIDLLVGPS